MWRATLLNPPPPTPHPRTRSCHSEHKRQIVGGDEVGIEGEHEGGKADVEEGAELGQVDRVRRCCVAHDEGGGLGDLQTRGLEDGTVHAWQGVDGGRGRGDGGGGGGGDGDGDDGGDGDCHDDTNSRSFYHAA